MKQYAAYKDCGNECLCQIPNHWDAIRLKFLVTYNDETLPETTNPERVVEYVGVTDIDSNEGVTNTTKYKFAELPSKARRITKINDVIISTIGIYYKAIAKIECNDLIVSKDFVVLRAKNIDANFLSYSAISNTFIDAVLSISKGVSRSAIRVSDLMELQIAVPPLSEQKKIASYLDSKCRQIDLLISEKEKQLADIQKYRDSIISEAVTHGINLKSERKNSCVDWIGMIPKHWNISRLKYVVSCNEKTLSETADSEGEFEFVGISDVKFPDGIVNTTKYKFKGFPLRAGRLTAKGDVVISTERTYLKAMAKIEKDDIIVSTRFAVLRAKEVDSRFLQYVLLTDRFADVVMSKSEGVSRSAISLNDLVNISIAIPTLVEQQQIVSYLDEKCMMIDSIVGEIKLEISSLKEYKSALISDAVTGKVCVE